MEESMRRKVLVINTGGTASMKHREDGMLDTVPGYLSERIACLEELGEPGMPEVAIKEYTPLIDSSHMEPDTWIKIASDIEENYEENDGFVVVMGTDTLSYAASACSFLLENLGKPVIFTGSQIPLCQPYTDCRRNILGSIILAGSGDYPEVCLFFGDKLMRACRTSKANSYNLDAFASPNLAPLATLATGIKINTAICLPQPKRRLRVQKELATGVTVIKLIPGYEDSGMHCFIKDVERLQAVVLEVYGSGGAPYHKPGLRMFVQTANERGVLVVAKSQCLTGSVLPSLYAANGSGSGVASAGDMTTEALVTKLAYLFARVKGHSRHDVCRKVRDLLLVSLRGEVSPPEVYTQQILEREPGLVMSKL
eukprot:gene15688-23948_t